MQATNPEQNILIRPNDVISRAASRPVYVIGEVKKAGRLHPLGTVQRLSGVRALAMADGLTPVPPRTRP